MSKKVSLFLIIVVFLVISISRPVAASSDTELPDIAFIEGIRAYGQTYPLSCESRSAADLASYWGVAVKETEFFHSLPVSDNPDKGFVGSVHGAWGQTPPHPYGVHAAPIAEHLKTYGLEATPHKNMTLEELKLEIANGRPVIVWVVGHVWKGVSQEYKAKDGSLVTVAPYEHTMLAYGYDLAGVYLIDAGNGMRRGYSYKIFSESWAVLGNMAVTATGSRDIEVQPTTFDKEAPGVYIVKKGDYLTDLARQWGIGWRDLAKLNDLAWPYTLHPGQTLITGKEATSDKVASKDPATGQEKGLENTDEAETDAATKIIQEGSDMEWSALETYIVLKGEHLMQISEKLQLSWEVLAKVNNLSPPYDLVPGQVLLLPDPDYDSFLSKPGETPVAVNEYVIQKGDYLYRIAQRFGVNWHVLADMNSIGAPYFVYPGQILQIPD